MHNPKVVFLKTTRAFRRSDRDIELRTHRGVTDQTSRLRDVTDQTSRLWNWFVRRQILSSAFPLYIFLMLALTQSIHIPHVSRYDLLLLLCLAAQAAFLWMRYETIREFKVIMAFHAIGLLLEIYKTHFHAWAYPGPSILHIAGVPLYSGFMYASVASYICQAWRRLNLRLVDIPNWTTSTLLAIALYVNFFTERFFLDLRWPLIALVFWHFRKTYVEYGPSNPALPSEEGEGQGVRVLRMPLSISLVLIGLFVWLAENFGTLCAAWQYPNQHHGWQIVHASKMSSWFMLVVIEFLIVARLKCRQSVIAVKTIDEHDLSSSLATNISDRIAKSA